MPYPSGRSDTRRIRTSPPGKTWKIVLWTLLRKNHHRQLPRRQQRTLCHLWRTWRQPSQRILRQCHPQCNRKNTQIFEQEYAKEKNNVKAVITRVLSKTDDQLKLVGASDTGTTCCLAFVRKQGSSRQCFVANLGDTRAVLSIEGIAKRVSVDHKPTTPSEIERIKYKYL